MMLSVHADTPTSVIGLRSVKLPSGATRKVAAVVRTLLFAQLVSAQALSAQARGDYAADGALRQLSARIAAVPGAQVGIAVHDLASGRRLSIAGDTVFHAASTMKVPVLFALFKEFEGGRLRAGERMRVANRFRSIVDSSDYTLNASDDSDSTVYTWIGRDVPRCVIWPSG